MPVPPDALPADRASAPDGAAAAVRRWIFVNRVLLDSSRALGDGRAAAGALAEFTQLCHHSEQARTDVMRQLAREEERLRLALRVLDGPAGRRAPLARAGPPCDTAAAMDRKLERQHLEIADRHIAEARPRIAAQEELIASGRLSQQELDEAVALLRSMHRTLAEFEEHRDAIVRLLDGADSGAP